MVRVPSPKLGRNKALVWEVEGVAVPGLLPPLPLMVLLVSLLVVLL